MTSHALRPTPRRLRRRSLNRQNQRKLVTPNTELLSVAGVIGSPVYDRSKSRIGSVADLVVCLEPSEAHPPLYGVIVRGRHKRMFAPQTTIATLARNRLELRGTLDRGAPEKQPGHLSLAHDVLDRQIVDADGVDVVRVSDLVLSHHAGGIRLVGADVSARTLLRRLGPRRLKQKVVAARVYDWASVAAVSVRGAGEVGAVLRLTDAAARLQKLKPADLDLLLGDLPAGARDQFVARLDTEPDS